MDDCSDAIHELYSFIDGELTDARREAIKDHLSACGECFEAFDFEAELKTVVAQKCRDSVPEDLKSRIAQLLQDEV